MYFLVSGGIGVCVGWFWLVGCLDFLIVVWVLCGVVLVMLGSVLVVVLYCVVIYIDLGFFWFCLVIGWVVCCVGLVLGVCVCWLNIFDDVCLGFGDLVLVVFGFYRSEWCVVWCWICG